MMVLTIVCIVAALALIVLVGYYVTHYASRVYVWKKWQKEKGEIIAQRQRIIDRQRTNQETIGDVAVTIMENIFNPKGKTKGKKYKHRPLLTKRGKKVVKYATIGLAGVVVGAVLVTLFTKKGGDK